MITVGDVVADRTLNLQVVAGAAGLDREVTSAHVSELTSPGDWLRGGELLMTVGLLLPMTLPRLPGLSVRVRGGRGRRRRAGPGARPAVSGVPRRAADAAEEVGVPLLMVPDETPFIAVTKWVFETIAGAGAAGSADRDGDQPPTDGRRDQRRAAAGAAVGVVEVQRHAVRGLRRPRTPDGGDGRAPTPSSSNGPAGSPFAPARGGRRLVDGR